MADDVTPPADGATVWAKPAAVNAPSAVGDVLTASGGTPPDTVKLVAPAPESRPAPEPATKADE